MKRKQVAIVFMMLAGLVLVIHAFLPHHHHDQQFCFESSCCAENSGIAKHFCNNHNHEHDENSSPGNCLLKQLVFLPSVQEKIKPESCLIIQKIHHNIYNQLFPEVPDLLLSGLEDDLFYKDFALPDLIHFISASGLRAPPIA